MQTITLNLVPDGACEVVHVNQYDVGREFIIRFRDDGVNAVINNPTVKINGRKSDQHAFLYTESDTYDGTHPIITKSGSGITFQVSIKTTEQMTAATGDVLCQLTLEKTGSTIGTLNFILRVQEQPYATGDASETELPSIIAEATEQMEAAAASAQQAEDAVAHYPYINSTNKNWMVYNAIQGEFVDTGVRAQGIDGSGAVQTVNNVLPDANGNVDVKWSDMSSVSNLAITEETRTMTAQRVEGSYVFVKADDQLYEVTTTIDANGTLTPGTNATARSVGYVLAQLNSDLANKAKMERLHSANTISVAFTNSLAVVPWSTLDKFDRTKYLGGGMVCSCGASDGVLCVSYRFDDTGITLWSSKPSYTGNIQLQVYAVLVAK